MKVRSAECGVRCELLLRLVVLLSLAFLFHTPHFALSTAVLAAQQPADTLASDTAIAIEGVVVSTARATPTVGGTSAILVQPDSLHLAPGATLEQVLRELPFVTVRENSRGEAELSVRGSESRQVAVLLDGVPLTLGWDHRTDPSIIPVTGAQSILLVRGLHSVLYGPNVLGGVVEVGVAQGASPERIERKLQLRAGADHLGGRAASLTGAAPLQVGDGDLAVRAGAGYRARPGFALPSGVGDLDGDDDLRLNSDLDLVDGFLALRYHGGDGEWMGLSASGYHTEHGVPPELHVEEPRLWRYPGTERLLAVLSAGTGQRLTVWGQGDLEASVGVDVGSADIESFASTDYRQIDGRESSDTRTLTARLLGDHTLGRVAMLRAALTFADVHHDELIDRTDASEYRQRLWSAAGEVEFPLAADTRLSGGLVLDGADTPESGDKPPLGTLWAWGARVGANTLALDGTVRLHAAASRRARFPSLRELYSGALGRFAPNPNLEPETLWGLEAGGTTRRGGTDLQAVVFHHRLSDAIVRTSAGDGRFRRENRDQIRSTGVELLAGWERGGLSLLGDLMLQNVRVIDPSVPEGERRPEHQPEFRVGLDATVPLLPRLRALASAAYTGRQFCVHPDRDERVTLEGSGRVDIGVERAWRLPRASGLLRTLRSSVWLDNVNDAAVYDQCGLPQPGRTLRFAVEVG